MTDSALLRAARAAADQSTMRIRPETLFQAMLYAFGSGLVLGLAGGVLLAYLTGGR